MTLPPWIDSLLQRVLPAWVDRALVAKAISFGLVGGVNATVDSWFLDRASLLWACAGARQRDFVVRRGIRFLCHQFVHHFRGGVREALALPVVRHVRGVAVGGLIANTLAVFVASFWIPVLAAKLLAILASFVVNFSLSHFVVFRRAPQRERRPNRTTGDCRFALRRESDDRAADLRHPSRMLRDRRALSGRRGAQPVARRQAAAGALRSRRRAQGADQGRAGAAAAGPLALPRAAAGAPRRRHRQPRRGA